MIIPNRYDWGFFFYAFGRLPTGHAIRSQSWQGKPPFQMKIKTFAKDFHSYRWREKKALNDTRRNTMKKEGLKPIKKSPSFQMSFVVTSTGFKPVTS